MTVESLDPSPLLLPRGTRLLHIGPHKTGSTAIQVSLHERRQQLLDHGVVYAGHGRRDRRAGWALGLAGLPLGTERPPVKHWRQLVGQVQEAGPEVRVCVSNEDFARADDATARTIAEELGGGAAHVVAVARRLDRFLPSQWQERVKAGETRSYEDWLHVVLGDDPRAWDHRNVWNSHDTTALVRRWSAAVGPQNVTVLVSDDSDRRLLPDVFEQLLGLPAGFLELFPDQSNRSLTYEEAEFLRAVNSGFADRGLDRASTRPLTKRGAVAELTRRPALPGGTRGPGLPAWARDRVAEISRERVAGLASAGVRVVGDPEALLVPDGPPVVVPERPSVAADVAAAALVATVAEALSAAAAPRSGKGAS